jgi:hypothetical protein
LHHEGKAGDGFADIAACLVMAATPIDQKSLPGHKVTIGRRQEECRTGKVVRFFVALVEALPSTRGFPVLLGPSPLVCVRLGKGETRGERIDPDPLRGPRPVKWCMNSDAPSSRSSPQLAMSRGVTSSSSSSTVVGGSMALASDSWLM